MLPSCLEDYHLGCLLVFLLYSAQKLIFSFVSHFSLENDHGIEDSNQTMLRMHLILFPRLVHLWECIC